jgi:4'-phosphopantetheinyl transferase
MGAVPGAFEAKSSLEIFFVDLVKSEAVLDVEERRTPRLSAIDVERAKSLAGDGERCRLWRAARIATRIVLERAGGVGLRNISFEIEPGGRPMLGARSPYFNVSHSGEGALIAVSKEMPMGVDLERKRVLTMSGDRRRRIVAAAERLAYKQPLAADNDDDVLIAWVRLEAAAKAVGTGIGRLLTEEGVIGGKREDRERPSAHKLAIKDLAVADGYVAALAAERLPETVRVISFPSDDLCEFLGGALS